MALYDIVHNVDDILCLLEIVCFPHQVSEVLETKLLLQLHQKMKVVEVPIFKVKYSR